MTSSSGKYPSDGDDDECTCVTNYVNGAYHVLAGKDLDTPRKRSDSSRRSSEGTPLYFIGKSHSSPFCGLKCSYALSQKLSIKVGRLAILCKYIALARLNGYN